MIPCSLSESCVMDDEDDRRLLDIIGDVQALNDYLHGSTNKSIEEDDVTNAAYGSAGTFFNSNTTGSNAGLKDEEFEDSAGAGLQLSSSLSFIEDELGGGTSPGGMDLGEDQPFDILQKSLMEADITEQTLAQEAMLDSQPPPPSAPSQFPPQLVSGGYSGGGTTAAFPGGQFIQGVSNLPNGQAGGHIQVLGSFGGGGVQQILLRQGVGVGGAVGGAAGGQVFATPSPAGQVNQVGLPFKNIPLQNIIIQRGPGGTQALVRPIQPKPLQGGGQTVYSLGLQTTTTTMVNAAAQGHYTANGSIMVHSPQNQGPQGQASLPPGQYLVHHNGPSEPSQSTMLANQNTVQLVTGQNFTATAGGQLIQVGGSQDKQAQTQLVNLLGNKAVKTMTSTISQDSSLNTQVSAQKRPAPQQLTRGGMMLQQLRMDHSGVLSPDITRFTSLDDALERLLPYHVFHGAASKKEEFSQVDDEFESMATQVLKRTQVMINKYRRLLMVEAERSSPSSEMVMIDRTFNQEERQNLTQDKRMILVDPDGFLDDFCCGTKSSSLSAPSLPSDPLSSSSSSLVHRQTGRGVTPDPHYRTDPESGFGDPGGGGGGAIDSVSNIMDLKRTQQSNYGNIAASSNNNNNSNYHHCNESPTVTATVSTGTEQTRYLSHLPSLPQAPLPLPSTPPDTDSVLEAAVNSILEC
ncbi:BRD4-interacting chromatin-remodeling complex-associated protein-like isoform X3 [Esox lucius]|uniref:BRD4-interacting chromatin-remodeling complex-associated protein-like isoform X3 n=1 Tax=Esox lucius TaxID=8010 RepID=UPI0014772CFC|nr:BRD4-interacting chromatin-remodeling complex-associated protein-like isoform X3 [Esox lucius]